MVDPKEEVITGSGATYDVAVTTTTFPFDIVDVRVATTSFELCGTFEIDVLVEPCGSTLPGEESLVVNLVKVPGLVIVTPVAEGGVDEGVVVATDEVTLVVVRIVVKVVARVVEVVGEGGDEGDDGVGTEKKLTLEGLVVDERRVELAVSLS